MSISEIGLILSEWSYSHGTKVQRYVSQLLISVHYHMKAKRSVKSNRKISVKTYKIIVILQMYKYTASSFQCWINILFWLQDFPDIFLKCLFWLSIFSTEVRFRQKRSSPFSDKINFKHPINYVHVSRNQLRIRDQLRTLWGLAYSSSGWNKWCLTRRRALAQREPPAHWGVPSQPTI